MEKQQSISPALGRLFYLYFALLSLLTFSALYFETDVWFTFTHYISAENAASYFLYHAFCAITFFVSAILPLVIIQSTPLPRNKWIALLIIFDAPVFILVDYLSGNAISFSEILMYDFVIEMLAFSIADILLRITKKSHQVAHLIVDIYSIALVFSFYGTYSFKLVADAGVKSWLITLFTLSTSIYGYYKVLEVKSLDISKADDLQAQMSKVGSFAMMATWALMAFVYAKALFF